MCRREIMDKYLRDRAIEYGAEPINGLVTSIDIPANHKTTEEPYTINYLEFTEGSAAGEAKTMDVDVIVGADGANSRVAKCMDAGLYNFAIAFQERIKISDDKMKFYEEMAEMYVGDDVSPTSTAGSSPSTTTSVSAPAPSSTVPPSSSTRRPSATVPVRRLPVARSSRSRPTPSPSTTVPAVSRAASPSSATPPVTSPSAPVRASTSPPSPAAWPPSPSSSS